MKDLFHTALFRALRETVAPAARDLLPLESEEGLRNATAIVQRQPSSVRARLTIFLVLIHLSCILFTGRTFVRASPSQRLSLLEKFRDAPVPLFRKGFWGLAALIKVSVYAVPSVQRRIGMRKRDIPQIQEAHDLEV